MKRLLLPFIPLVFFFGCEKDNPDANVLPPDRTVGNTCAYSHFNVNGSANHDGEYLLSFVPVLTNAGIVTATDETGTFIYSYSTMLLYFENEGEWELQFTLAQDGDSVPNFVEGLYSNASLPISASSFEEQDPVFIGSLYFIDNENSFGNVYTSFISFDGLMGVDQEDQNYIIQFSFVDEYGVEITGCYSGEINTL